MMKNCSEADYMKHVKRITEGELWGIVETRKENVKNIWFADEIMERDKTGYSIHTIAEVVGGENIKDWILVTRSRIGK